MDAVLQRLGVVQGHEDEVISNILTNIQQEQATGKTSTSIDDESSSSNAILSNIAQAIISDEIIQIDGQSLEEGEIIYTEKSSEVRQSGIKLSQKKKKQGSSGLEGKIKIIANESGAKPIFHDSPKRVDGDVLNGLVMGAISRSSSLANENNSSKLQNSTKSFQKTSFSFESSEAGNANKTERFICPICQRQLFPPEERFDEYVANHVERCRPSKGLTYSNTSNHLTDDESCQESVARPNKRLRKSKTSPIDKDKGSDEEDHNAVDLDDHHEGGSHNKSAFDDWEEDDYLLRVSRLTKEEKKVTETSFGTQVQWNAWEKLYNYQKEGCNWLYSLYNEGVGGILADEMGLGKTAQICTHFSSLGYLTSLLNSKDQAIFLIVCPATVVEHWLKEFHHWAPLLRVGVMHSISPTGRELGTLSPKNLEKVIKVLRRSKQSPGVAIITTYETLRKHREVLALIEWSAVCLDEGQKIRNPTALISETCKHIPAFHRIILSGTPIQNSLRELWSLFDFIYPGRLGSLEVFEDEFAQPIRAGGYSHATKLQFEIAIRCAGTLQRIVRPYLLRRKKSDLALLTQLPAKTEQLLFCQISEKQKRLYLEVLQSDEVKAVIRKKIPAFRAINLLRKLCNHPALVWHDGRIVWDIVKEFKSLHRISAAASRQYDFEWREEDEDEAISALLAKDRSASIVWGDSGKLLVLSKILPLWKREGHKVLIFCQTMSMLDIIESMIMEMRMRYVRLDGSTAVGKRTELIDQFNADESIYVMLLTTRTGGVGISLTSANRVILFDPDWNPMTDIQARERAWRLGQKREVIIYRLITKGTIEEKIYQRQIFKLLLSNRILDNNKQKALFSKSQIEDLFQLTDSAVEIIGQNALPASAAVDLASDNQEEPKSNIGTASMSCEQMESEAQFSIETTAFTQQETLTNDDGNQDRLLLKALFDGDAITSVYDHDSIDPGVKRARQEKDPLIAREASNIANRAFDMLQNSAPMFSHSAAAPLPPAQQVMTSFGAHLSSSSTAGSSSTLLAAIRQSQMPQSSCSSSAPMPTSVSVEESIRTRLIQLFRSTPGMKLATNNILGNFRDLGDHYAPIFKRILKSVASLSGGVWTLREKL